MANPRGPTVTLEVACPCCGEMKPREQVVAVTPQLVTLQGRKLRRRLAAKAIRACASCIRGGRYMPDLRAAIAKAYERVEASA
jgi:hypothetical protein